MKVDIGTKNNRRALLVLVFSLIIFITWMENRPIPKVEFGYPQSKNSNINEFYDSINQNRAQIENKTRAMCNSLNGTVNDFAGYKTSSKGWHDKGIMKAIVPEIGFIEGWKAWSARLYRKAPLIYSTKYSECVLYPTNGITLLASRNDEYEVEGNIALSCCWDK